MDTMLWASLRARTLVLNKSLAGTLEVMLLKFIKEILALVGLRLLS